MTHQTERWPALDGMRAAAVAGVVIYHLHIQVLGRQAFGGGFGGVDVFFVLSGFLISTLLIREFDSRDTIDFKAFYARRSLRLFPALAVVIIFAVIAAATFAPASMRHTTFSGLPWVIFYVGNWARALGSPYALGLLNHTWSLAIEEQFYLLWPVIFLLFIAQRRDRRRVGFTLIGLAVVDMIYQFLMLYQGWSLNRLYNGLDSHCEGLLIGCGIAFLLIAREDHAKPGRWMRASGIGGICVLVVALIAPIPKSSFAWTAATTLVSAATGAVLWSMFTSPIRLLNLVLQSKLAVWVGRRSYGLYLWHYPLIAAIVSYTSTGPRRYGADLVVVILSLILTAVSFQLVEQPFLRLKSRFQRSQLGEPVLEANQGIPNNSGR